VVVVLISEGITLTVMIMALGPTTRVIAGSCSFLLHIIESSAALGSTYQICTEGFHALFCKKKNIRKSLNAIVGSGIGILA
jgi:hypothetical protein